MKRNLQSLLLHMYYSSIDQDYWGDRMVDWDFKQVPAGAILQQIYEDWTDGKIELSGIELNEFQELWICDLNEITGKRLVPIKGEV